VTKINKEEDPPQMITSKHKQTLTVAMQFKTKTYTSVFGV